MEEQFLIFKSEKYTRENIINALKDIDNNKYELSCTYFMRYALVYNKKEYPIKQICECLARNRGKIITSYDFNCNENLRQRFIKLGFNVIDYKREIEIPDNSINFYLCCQEENYEIERKQNILKTDAISPHHTRTKIMELKKGDIILHYVNSKIIAKSIVLNEYCEIKRDKDTCREVKVKYEDIDKPLSLEKIRELLNDKDDKFIKPFYRRTGRIDGPQGYLHPIKKELFNLLISNINISNTDQNGEKTMANGNNTYKTTLNQILYGPPGTGKTYNTVVKAMSIINGIDYQTIDEEKDNYVDDEKYKQLKEDFNTYKEQGRIEFITFHQSYSYEEFVEGIKPYIPNEVWKENEEQLEVREKNNNLPEVKYIGHKGIFKDICHRAEKAEVMPTVEDKYNYFKYLFDKEQLGTFHTDKGLDYIISKFDDKTFEISRIGGTPNSCTTEKFKNAVMLECDDLTSANLREKAGVGNGLEMNIVELRNYIRQLEVPPEFINKKAPYVLIIDEINRGNISKIFGELITLIEPDKRIGAEHELRVTLPYSQQKDFGVPQNLYIIGTMNTSDRSIASVDIALRRRFKFVEMMPKEDVVGSCIIKFSKEETNLQEIFKKLNQRICALLDRDHQIGHSYFKDVETVTDLKDVWFDCVMPLLNEYFYCDWEKLQAILGEAEEEKGTSFIQKFKTNDIFAKGTDNPCEEYYDFRKREDYYANDENAKFIKALENAFSTIEKQKDKDDAVAEEKGQ